MGFTAALGVVAVGTAFSAYSQMKAGQGQQQMFERNAAFAEFQAVDALARGKETEKRSRQNTNQVIGAQRTSFAAQGVDVNKGSPLDVQADAAYLGELDALTIRNNAAKEAYGYRTQGTDYRARGEVAADTGKMGALTTIIGSGGSLLLAKYGGGFGTRTPAYGPGY